MTSSRLSLLFVVLSGLLLAGCPTDGNRAVFDYLRSPITFVVDPVADNHPFCRDQNMRPDSMDQATCEATRKYRIRWERPEDTVGFEEYRIFVDTTPPNAPGSSWTDVRKTSSNASFVMAGRASIADSVIFFVTSTGQPLPQILDRARPALVGVDTTGRVDSLGRLVFAIATSYNGGGIEGQPRYTYVVTDDRQAPYPVLPAYTPQARSFGVAWSRPRDPTSFFDAKADSGVIAGYVLRVRRVNARPDGFAPSVTYRVGNLDRSSEVTFTDFTLRNEPGRRFWLPDSQRVVNRLAEDSRDSIFVTVRGLTPQDTLDVNLWAVDASGNATRDSGQATRILLTDTTQPSAPRLQLVAGSITRNRFAYTFTASRDSVETGGVLGEAQTPNANILEYRVTRRRIGGPAGERVIDSVLQVEASNRGNNIFSDTARYLPPGATYVIYVQAVDSSGHLSRRDSLVVTTSTSQFSGADSGAECPPGFIAMPEGSFYLGETSANSPSGDESGGRRTIKSFCIEPREHLASATTFRNRVTWQQAHDICRDMGSAAGDSTWLCTEGEWERACEGTEATALLYGVQSERQDPGGLRYTCNIGTGDSAMAMSASLRDPSCLSYDGAFDLSGNLAEWVMDPYPASSTEGYPGSIDDTLYPGRPLTPPTAGSRRGFRGNHYLNPGANPATLLRNARCSNRDYAAQLRPKPWPGCVDASRPQITVLYNDATKAPRCFPLPDSLANLTITNLAPARDTNQILILVQGRTNPLTYTMPKDTAYRNQKPSSALLTAQTLAIVTFENSETNQTIVDTLDASELLGRTEAQRAVVFARDAAPPWSVRKSGGVFQIQYLYAYTRSQSTTARAYYSNRALGFRCCAKPRP